MTKNKLIARLLIKADTLNRLSVKLTDRASWLIDGEPESYDDEWERLMISVLEKSVIEFLTTDSCRLAMLLDGKDSKKSVDLWAEFGQ